MSQTNLEGENPMEAGASPCAVCGIPSHLVCTACRNVHYCSKEHQKEDWRQGHKSECKCYRIERNEQLGRHVRATRDIKPGEVVLQEAPLISGPKITSAPVCLGCLTLLKPSSDSPTSDFYKCSKCNWPLCGPGCERSSAHQAECEFMSARGYKASIRYDAEKAKEKRPEAAYCVILPLRCYLLKRDNPSAYESFDNLEDHLEERKNSPLYNILRANLVTFMKNVLRIEDSNETDILRTAAILDTNTFDVRILMKNRKFRAVYPTAAMISHDCTPNTRHVFDENMNIVFIAKVPISKGEIISISYTNLLKSTVIRRLHLEQFKCFACACQRCADPTEYGTYTGSILCTHCKVGKLVSSNPLDNSAPWKCQLCSHTLDSQHMMKGYSSMNKEIARLDKSSPREFEQFLYTYREVLHEKNTHVLQVKYALSQLYGSAPGYQLSEMTDDSLKRKIELCKELLEVGDLFDAGCSDFRGHLLLDLSRTTRFLVNRLHDAGIISLNQMVLDLKYCADLLKEACDILKDEPDQADVIRELSLLMLKDLEVKDVHEILPSEAV